jgi:hypothetical protein
MPRRNENDVDVLDKVFEEGTSGHDYVVETEHGPITFELHRVSRARRQEFVASLPDELVEFMAEQEQEQERDLDVDDLSDLDEISDAKPDDAPPLSVMGREEVTEFADLIVEALDHPKITDRELREFMDFWSDEMFYATGFIVVSLSAESEGVDSFRTE